MNERPNGYRYYMFTTSYSTSCTCTDAAGMSAGYLSNYRNLIALLHLGGHFLVKQPSLGTYTPISNSDLIDSACLPTTIMNVRPCSSVFLSRFLPLYA